MKYLLDTHALIWYLEDSVQLATDSKAIIDEPGSSVYISAASLWEMAIKSSLGKLKMDMELDELFDAVNKSDFAVLQIEQEYLAKLAQLPFLHRDPFDRLIVATALCEDLVIVTKDENIRGYDVRWVW